MRFILNRAEDLPPVTSFRTRLFLAAAAVLAAAAAPSTGDGFLGSLQRKHMVGSTIPANGDLNPYAIVVSPVTKGRLLQGRILVDNFNGRSNLQGTGTTIVSVDPGTGALSPFADLPRTLAGCPGGVGLTTAMAVLRAGYVVVGSLPSQDGTTKSKGPGCLIVLDAEGRPVTTFAGPGIDGPWGNMAVIDRGDRATLFVSMAGSGVGAPGQPPVRQASIQRLELALPAGGTPTLASRTVVADGLPSQADASVFLVGPTGLALGADGTLYASDAIGNRIVAIDDAATRTTSAGQGRVVTKDGLLQRPLALTLAPNGNLITANGLNGQAVEIEPGTGRQVVARWLNADRAQTPPGSGNLFGLVAAPDGSALYFVEDDVNAVSVLR
jgi:hypothetical protein